jgi:excisionase family DNA binding protein
MSQHLQFNLDRLITIPQLAKKLTVSVRTIRDWIARRKIPFTRFQRRMYIDAGVIEQMMQRAQVPALSSPKPTLVEQGGAQTKGGVE